MTYKVAPEGAIRIAKQPNPTVLLEAEPDETAPEVASYFPADDATDVAVDVELVVTFNEPIALGASGTISLKLTSDDSTVDSWDVSADEGSGAGQLEVENGNELHLHVSANLAGATEFYVIWDAGVVEDLSGNAVAALSDTTDWSFITIVAAAFRAAAVSTAAAITIPAIAEVGDVAWLFDFSEKGGGTSATKVVPTDWTDVPAMGGEDGRNRLVVSYKVIEAGEPDSAVTGVDDGATLSKVMLVFSGGIASVAVQDADFEIQNGNPAPDTVTASGGTAPLVVLGVAGIGAPVTPVFSTASPAFDDTVTSQYLVVGYKVYQASPADHTIDMDDLGAHNTLASGYFEVS